MSAPKRIQRKRTKGWRMPEGAIYVGRPGVWGNHFLLHKVAKDWYCVTDQGAPVKGTYGTRRQAAKHAVSLFAEYDLLAAGPTSRQAIRRALAGKDLACWCPLDQPCHADVLLEIANRP